MKIDRGLFYLRLKKRTMEREAAGKIWRSWRAYKVRSRQGRKNLELWRHRRKMLENKKSRLQLKKDFQPAPQQGKRRGTLSNQLVSPQLMKSNSTQSREAHRQSQTPMSSKPTSSINRVSRKTEPHSANTKLITSDSARSPNSLRTDTSSTDKRLSEITEEGNK
jgi:hypothetical protein